MVNFAYSFDLVEQVKIQLLNDQTIEPNVVGCSMTSRSVNQLIIKQ